MPQVRRGRADARFRVAERLVARARVKLCVRHESCAAGQCADLAFEILDLVEVVAPVQEALGTGVTAQVHCIAQALAKAGQVPDPAIVCAVVVAGRAAHVGVACEPRVQRVVEQSLALEDLGSEFLAVVRCLGCKSRYVCDAFGQEFREVVYRPWD